MLQVFSTMSWGSSWLKEQKAREFLVEKLVLCHNDGMGEANQRKKNRWSSIDSIIIKNTLRNKNKILNICTVIALYLGIALICWQKRRQQLKPSPNSM